MTRTMTLPVYATTQEITKFETLLDLNLSCSTNQNMIPMDASIRTLYHRGKSPTLGVLDVLDDVDSFGVRLAGLLAMLSTSTAYVVNILDSKGIKTSKLLNIKGFFSLLRKLTFL